MDVQSALATKARVVALARAEGFESVRFALAGPLLEARETALDGLDAGHLDGLHWMTEAWLTRATDPGRFLAGARSVVIVALPYHGPEPDVAAAGPARGRIARYARGRDYHRVFEKKLRHMAQALRGEFGAQARPTVDYGPLLERPLAEAAGLGWRGKSTMLLAPGFGPWVLLGAIATDLDIEPDPPLKKSCGSCTRCVVACPTGALSREGAVLDARLCISYHTIENRGPIPRELRPLFGDWIFGCDACLDACPVGARSFASYPEFEPPTVEDARPALAPLLALDEAAFIKRYRGKAIMRAKRAGFVRNVCVALGNVGTEADLGALLGALDDGSPLVRGHAAWALGELATRLTVVSSAVAIALAERLEVETDPWVCDEIVAADERLYSVP